jgi:hypothetical protein
MKTTVQRVAGRVADTVREMNEAQRLALALRTSTESYTGHLSAPDTYEEFLARTSGALVHEPSARKRARRARRG